MTDSVSYSYQALVAGLEPGPTQVVRFGRVYDSNPGKVYTYCAVRTDSLNDRRWFLSGGSGALRGSIPDSPCTWIELFEFASTPIEVAGAWFPVRIGASGPVQPAELEIPPTGYVVAGPRETHEREDWDSAGISQYGPYR